MLNPTNYQLHLLAEKLMKDRAIVQEEIARRYENGISDDIEILFDRDVALAEEIEKTFLLLSKAVRA